MRCIRQALAATVLGLACAAAAAAGYKAPALSEEAAHAARWIVESRDHAARPYAIVDKKRAHLYVFNSAGQLQGDSPVLIGEAPGDGIAPGVGEHAQQGIVPFEERTTPAGRFDAEPGVNNTGDAVIWVDYDAAFAIHRLRPGKSLRNREARLASADLADRRASSGCVVVPVRFYEDVVLRWLGEGRSVVYVLPENGSVRDLTGAF